MENSVGSPKRQRRPRKKPSRSPKTLVETSGPAPDEPIDSVMLSIGVVVGNHGVEGEMKIRPHTDELARFFDRDVVWLGNETEPRRIDNVRVHNEFVLLALEGIATTDDAAGKRGSRVRIPAATAGALHENEFFLFQIIGLEVFDESGNDLGSIADLIETGAREVFVVRHPDRNEDLLLPNIPDVVLDIKPSENTMIVRPLRYIDDAGFATP